MRGYWLRIVLGAAAIFVVGMLIVSAFDAGRQNVEAVVEGTGPITIPLAFIPLDLDGRKVGTLRRVTVFRDSLQQPTRIEASISIGDTSALARLASCVVTIEEVDARGNVQPNRYRCLLPGDTVGADLVEFGELEIRSRTERFPLFAPRAQVEELTSSFGHRATESDSLARDSVEAERERVEALADSMAEAADSIHGLEMRRIDSLRRSAAPE